MRSSELAALAGVTVRTLRHYHQIGILDEPERSVNGYRDYDVRHLTRLLRITRLAELGLPLAALPNVLDDHQAAEAMLDELDRQAAHEIERLTTRRANIARLRSQGAMPDLPPEMAALGPTLSAVADTAPDMARHEREQVALISRLVDRYQGPGRDAHGLRHGRRDHPARGRHQPGPDARRQPAHGRGRAARRPPDRQRLRHRYRGRLPHRPGVTGRRRPLQALSRRPVP